MPWQEEQSAHGEPALCHDLPAFNVDLVTLDLLDPQRVQELLYLSRERQRIFLWGWSLSCHCAEGGCCCSVSWAGDLSPSLQFVSVP